MFGEWTPVKDDTPKKSGHYLVTNKHGAVFGTDYHYDEVRGYWGQTGAFVPIAWMEMPEGYTEQDD